MSYDLTPPEAAYTLTPPDAASNLPTSIAGIPVPQSVAAGVVGAGHGFDSLIQGLMQLVNKMPGREQQAAEQNRDQAYEKRAFGQLTDQSTSAKVGDVAGQVLPFVAGGLGVSGLLAKSAPGLAEAMAARPFATAAAQGAAQGALPYVDDSQSRVTNGLLGAAGGVAGQGLASGVSRLIGGPASVLTDTQQQLVKDALDSGYKLDPGQVTGSAPLQMVGKVLSTLPISSKMAANVAKDNQAITNRRVLETVGGDASEAGPDTMSAIKSAISKEYDRLKASPTPVAIDDSVKSSLSSIREQEMMKSSPDSGLLKVLNDLIGPKGDAPTSVGGVAFGDLPQKTQDKILSAIGPTQAGKLGLSLSPSQFQVTRSELSDIAAKGGSVGREASQANRALDDAMGRSLSPEDATAWQTARQQYQALKNIEPSITPAGNVDAKALYRSLDDNATIYGETRTPQMQTLADVARQAKGLPQPPSSSNTSELAWYRKLLTNPLALAGALSGGSELAGGDHKTAVAAALIPLLMATGAGRAYYSNTASKWAQQGIPTLKELALSSPGIADALSRAVPALSAELLAR